MALASPSPFESLSANPPLPSLPQPLDISGSASTQPVQSFKDTLLDESASFEPIIVTYEELVATNLNLESLTPMAKDGTNPPKTKIPKVKIPKSIWHRLCAPWKNVVIIKLLRKSVNFHDYSQVLTRGSYKMFDHYLAVQPWDLGFHPARAKAPKTAVWVKLHGVPIVCYHEAICLYLGGKIGKLIKVDPTTLLTTRGKFARVCIEVDLSQQFPSSVDLDLEDLPQSLILVEVEGLHKICFYCGEFGHIEDSCRFKNPNKSSPPVSNPNSKAMIELTPNLKPNSEENTMVFGPWMVQQRKAKRRQLPCLPVERPADESLIPLKSQDSQLARVSCQIKDPMGPSMPMDIITPNPPPAPSTSFVKPKPKK
ncbi:hypothetical protein SLEP1_g18433 [Rubroshorea leprosula]|uniref:CCHC-type domain-containing protein n=1 Tax=Rubroshorea leprosula TaxID=152421 RepID=A0AAV5IXI9_9ROSI|nr:hypothetical protein SLEP1_g18433 [Rubroshorea leprosula]